MMKLKKVKIRRERAPFPVVVFAFLMFSTVFFLSTVGVKEEKAVSVRASGNQKEIREFALADLECFLISLSEGTEAESVFVDSARYMQRGAAGYPYHENGKWHSIGNVYFSKDEAERMQKHLLKNGIKVSVLPMFQKGVSLRVTAEEKTLESFSFCLDVFSEFEKNLMDYSGRLDAGKLTEREARVLISVLLYDLSKERAQVQTLLPLAGENTVKIVFQSYLRFLESISELTKNEGGEMMLSARIKKLVIESVIERNKLLKSLQD